LDLRPVDRLQPPPEGAVLVWDSNSGRERSIKADAVPAWTQPLPAPPEGVDGKARAAALSALSSLNTDLSGPSGGSGLLQAKGSEDLGKRRLAVRATGALDDLQRMIEALADKELDVRRAAIETARQWIATGRDHDYEMFEQLQKTYSPDDAEIVMTLLHL